MEAIRRFISSLTPTRCRIILVMVLLAGFVSHIGYLTYNPPIELSGDEAHYWDWSRQLDWSYYSKGPAVACVIRLGCMLFGDTMFGVRFPALVLALATSLCMYWFTRRAFKSDRLALGTVMLCHCVPMFVAGSMLMTIDPPYYLCWAMATCFGYLATIERKRWAWPLIGLCVGLGFLAKYAALLWFVCLLVFLLTRRDQRRWLASPWPYLSFAVALLFTIPILIWNQQHDWVTFGHVARSTTENQSHFNPLKILGNFGEMLGSQIGILNPIVAGFMVGGVVFALRRIRAVARQDASDAEAAGLRDSLAYLVTMGVTFFVIVAGVTLFKDIQPNWPAPTYFTLVPLAAWFIAEAWPKTRGWLIATIVIGLIAAPVLHYSSALYPIIPITPRKWDPGMRLRLGGPLTGAAVARELRTLSPGAFVLCDKYQTTGLMAFYVEGHPKAYCIGSYIADPNERERLSQYDMWPDRALDQPSLIGKDAVFVGHEQPDLYTAFDRVARLDNLPIVANGVTIREQKLFRCYGFKGMTRANDGLTKR